MFIQPYPSFFICKHWNGNNFEASPSQSQVISRQVPASSNAFCIPLFPLLNIVDAVMCFYASESFPSLRFFFCGSSTQVIHNAHESRSGLSFQSLYAPPCCSVICDYTHWLLYIWFVQAEISQLLCWDILVCLMKMVCWKDVSCGNLAFSFYWSNLFVHYLNSYFLWGNIWVRTI